MPPWNIPGKREPGMRWTEPYNAFVDAINEAGIAGVPVEVQNAVGMAVRRAYVDNWKEYRASGGAENFSRFYSHDNPNSGFARVLDRQLDMSLAARAPISFSSDGKQVQTTVGQLAPGLSDVRTVRDANRFLLNSMIPALSDENLYGAAIKGVDQRETYNIMAEAVLDATWRYTPFYKDRGTGQLRSRSLLTHVSYAVRGAETAWRRANQRVVGESLFNDDRNSPTGWAGEFVNPPQSTRMAMLEQMQVNARSSGFGRYGYGGRLGEYLDAGDVVKHVAPGSLLSDMGVSPGDIVPGLGAIISGNAYAVPGNTPNRPGYLYDLADQLEAGVPQRLSAWSPIRYSSANDEVIYGQSVRGGKTGFNPIRADYVSQKDTVAALYWASNRPTVYTPKYAGPDPRHVMDRGWSSWKHASPSPDQPTIGEFNESSERLSADENGKITIDAQEYAYRLIPFEGGIQRFMPSHYVQSQQLHSVRALGRAQPIRSLLTNTQQEINRQVNREIGNPNREQVLGRTVMADEQYLDQLLSTLSPSKRAAVQTVGSTNSDMISEWSATIRQLNEQYNTQLSTDPVQFLAGYQELQQADPTTAARFSPYVASRAQQLAYLDKKGRSRLAQVNRQMAGTPVQAKASARQPSDVGKAVPLTPAEAPPANPPLTAVRGGGGALPPAPPAVTLAADYEEDDYDLMRGYENKELRGDEPTPRQAYETRQGARRALSAKLNPSDYLIDHDNPVNSLKNFDIGFQRWANWDKNPFTGAKTRSNYGRQVERSFGILSSLDNRKERAGVVAGQLFGFLQPSHQAAVLAAANEISPPIVERGLPMSEVHETISTGGMDLRDPFVDRRMSARGSLGDYARLRAMTNDEYEARARRETRTTAASHGGEVLFARDTEVANIKSRFASPELTVDTMLYGKFRVGKALDPNRQGSLPAGINMERVEEGKRWAEDAFSQASSGMLPGDSIDALATIDARVNKLLRNRADAMVKKLEQQGAPREEAQNIAEIHETIARGVYKSAKKLAAHTSPELDAFDRVGSEAATHSQPTRTLTGIQDVLGRRAGMAEKAAKMGMNPEQLASLPEEEQVVLTDRATDGSVISERFFGADPSGRPYSAEVGGAGGRRSPLSIWGGQAGKLLYGAYIAKRMWGMAAQPVMQQSEQYGNYMSSVGYLSAYGEENPNLLSTEAGFASRQALGEQWLGRGANQQFGFFQTLPYYMSGAGEGVSRQFATAKTAMGIGAISSLAPMFMPGVSPGTAAILSKAGWGVGAAIMGTSLALEGANFLGHTVGELPEYENISMSSVMQEAFVTQPAYRRAIKSYNEEVSRTAKQHGVSADAAGEMLGLPTGMPVSLANKWTTMTFTDEQRAFLSPYMSYEDQIKSGVNISSEQRRKMERVRKLGEAAMEAGAGDDAAAGINALFKAVGEGVSDEYVRDVVQGALSSGRTLSGIVSEAGGYAASFGHLPGTTPFSGAVQAYARPGLSETERSQLEFNAGRVGALGSQVQAQIGRSPGLYGMGARLVDAYSYQTQAQVGGATSMIGAMQQYGGTLNAAQLQRVMSYAGGNPYQSGINANLVGNVGFLGGTLTQMGVVGSAFAGLGLTNQQAANFNAVLSGDLGAASYMGWQSGDVSSIYRDRANNSIFDTNGAMALRNIQAHPETGVSQGLFGSMGGWNLNTPYGRQGAAAQFLGTSDQGLVNAFLNEGSRGMAHLQAERNYGFQMAGIGVQVAGVRLNQQFYWGSGSYEDPAAGSMWGYEDRSRQMAYASQKADFAASRQQMQLAQEGSIAREGNSLARMNLSQSYNNWQQSASYNQSLMQRGWSQEDWGYQDQMRALNFGWQMEDMDENIRFSSGRQRRVLVRQKERAVLSQNLEDEQIEKSRERQQQTWALEDERYNKTREYTLELQRLDRESFDLNKKQREESYALEKKQYERRVSEYQESYALQEQITELQRKHQAEQLDLSLQSAGVSAAAAASQREYEIATTNLIEKEKDHIGEIQKLNSYDNAYRVAQSLTTLAMAIDRTDQNAVRNLQQMFTAIAGIANNPSLRLLVEGTLGGNP